MLLIPICPNCQVVWSIEEIDWGCNACGYPNINADFLPEDEDDYPEDHIPVERYTVIEENNQLRFEHIK